MSLASIAAIDPPYEFNIRQPRRPLAPGEALLMCAAGREQAQDRPRALGLLFLLAPPRSRPDRATDADPGVGHQDFCSHFSKMASHRCVAHLTESSALIEPVATLAIISVMMKLL
jgi:hypothetical protein